MAAEDFCSEETVEEDEALWGGVVRVVAVELTGGEVVSGYAAEMEDVGGGGFDEGCFWVVEDGGEEGV